MSLAHFDEIYEICCEEVTPEAFELKKETTTEHPDHIADCVPETYRWWEHALKEILEEKADYELYV